ncbi:lactate permease [Pseudoalteromonas sp. S3178]|uniref:lactate permease n=1 Tax=Pseudoalteromonas sp. S3178 TaxID=579532 RepID=UPI00110AA766|nr:lactate permease [Pseudoalteromonas sp. S3178]TMP02990.1 lactate permease [Pseudoalteromonas sp. S3178]
MSSRIDRFKKRKEIIKKNQSLPFVRGVTDQDQVVKLLNKGVDNNRLKILNYSTDNNISLQTNSAEIESLLSELKASFHKDKLEQLIDETKRGVISSIAGPFGLGKIISAYDKTGGNVDTVHNAREGIYATTEEKQRYDERGDYNSSDYHGHKDYKNKNKEDSKLQSEGTLSDSYTGNVIDGNSNRQLDHTISANEVHNDAGRILAEVDGPSAANSESNLNSTSEHINNKSGKGALTSNEFLSKLERTAPERKARIEELTRKQQLTSKESRELERLHEHDAVDADRMRQIDENARHEYDAKINKDYYTSKKFVKSTLSTGANEGMKMGVQQAFGCLLVEFFSNAMLEIKDAYTNGLEGDSLYKDIKSRLIRIGRNVADKWKEAIEGFSDGFISGFISNLITTLVNMFVTTAKRFVRMIREGVFSLLKALKLILFPPTNMSFTETMHEAMRLIAAGGVVVAGVALEEIIEKLILGVPLLAPFAPIATAVIIGSLTAIAMSLVAYLIDNMDILGAIKAQESKFILESLDKDIDEKLNRCERISEKVDEFLSESSLLLQQST